MFILTDCVLLDRKQSSSSFSSCSTSSELPGPPASGAATLGGRPGMSSSSVSLSSPRRPSRGPSSGARDKRQSHLADIQSDGGESDDVSDAETEIIGTKETSEESVVKRRVTSAGGSGAARGGLPVARLASFIGNS